MSEALFLEMLSGSVKQYCRASDGLPETKVFPARVVEIEVRITNGPRGFGLAAAVVAVDWGKKASPKKVTRQEIRTRPVVPAEAHTRLALEAAPAIRRPLHDPIVNPRGPKSTKWAPAQLPQWGGDRVTSAVYAGTGDGPELELKRCPGGCGERYLVPVGQEPTCLRHAPRPPVFVEEGLDEWQAEVAARQERADRDRNLASAERKNFHRQEASPELRPGAIVHAADQNNYGRVISLRDGSAVVYFFNRETECAAEVELPLSLLTVVR